MADPGPDRRDGARRRLWRGMTVRLVDFAGAWRVSRAIEDLLGAQQGRFEGEATFAPEGAVTAMTVEMTCGSAEQLEQFIRFGIAEGTAKTLANLVARMEAGG